MERLYNDTVKFERTLWASHSVVLNTSLTTEKETVLKSNKKEDNILVMATNIFIR